MADAEFAKSSINERLHRYSKAIARVAHMLVRGERTFDKPIARPPVIGPDEDEPVSYFRPTRNLQPTSRKNEILDGIGIDRKKEGPHIIRFVEDVPLDFALDGTPSFEEFRQSYSLEDEHVDSSQYVGELTSADFKALRTALTSDSFLKHEDGDNPLSSGMFEDISSQVAELLDNNFFPNHTSYVDAQKLLLDGHTTPITYGYRSHFWGDIRGDKKALYWIDGVFGGEVTLKWGEPYIDPWAGGTSDGEITVSLRDLPVGQLYCNSWGGNEMRWSVDPYIRREVLGETDDRPRFTQL